MAAAVVVVAPVRRVASTTQGVLLVHPLLEMVLRMKVPMILPARRVIISSRNPKILPLIVLAINFLPVQLNLPTEVAAEVVVVVAAEVTAEVTRKVFVAHDGNTTVVALQARRTHLHFS